MIRAKVLLVDDEVVFAENMSTLLTTRGYVVKVAHSGDNAIRALEEEEFDIVVLDLKMPGMDGIATLKEIKKLGLITETLILTGHGAVDTAMEAMRLGAYDYLSKPCDIEELVEKLEKAKIKRDVEKTTDLNEKIQRIVESPRAVLSMFKKKGKE